ncbi:MAG TPA: 4'-phosphopantetheinyl transferase superfamily protein [Solirubrobacterales bacterium]|nr:4'-phosphopantetheinyl transferase superfamily protein [Solirubrobacterales bacterium]
MIEAILPAAVAVAEADAEERPVALFPEEEAAIARAVPKRRLEFAVGRDCAHRALGALGEAPGPVPTGERGEPVWPAGVVGSITHCDGYRGCAVARTTDLAALGIDAEPHAPLPAGLIDDIARPEERGPLAALAAADPSIHWDRLLFSAKESVYKAWFPLARRWLGFEDVVATIDPGGTFAARLLVPGPVVAGTALAGFEGRWLVTDGLVATAIAIR